MPVIEARSVYCHTVRVGVWGSLAEHVLRRRYLAPQVELRGAAGDVQYERPPLEARYAWFDFFRPDYEWMDHFDQRGQPDSDYLRNRIARLTFDLKTGEAQIEK